MSNIPNLFIAGAPKSGTTALAHNLAIHEDIYLSSRKEPRYFDAHTFFDFEEDYPIKNLNDYLELFSSAEAKDSKYRLDASVFNMYGEKSIDEILRLSPDAKFIVLLRDPVSASTSMHKQRLKYPLGGMRELSEDFLECWSMLDERKKGNKFPSSCRNKFLFRYDLLYSYERYIPYLISTIKPENLFIGFYEEYKNDANDFFKAIFQFLDIKYIELENKIHNESYMIKKSYFIMYLQFISKFTFSLRKKLGLTGNKLSGLKNFIYSFYKTENKSDSYDLSSVKEYFKETYKYIDKLKADY
ncbi:MAG: sulfotransferase, partial [Sulfurimonadaceae bacterium]